MTIISFKSVGKTVAQTQVELLTTTDVPVGIKTPMVMGTNNDGIWAMNSSLDDQVADNLRNLILTNWGEHLGIYNFGANLKELTTNIVSQDDFDTEVISRIRDAVQRWMPFISLETFESKIDNQDNSTTGKVKLSVTYNIPTLNTTNRTIEITLYVI
jgi:phage baseplate assembly protein W